jgi:hypothetical protein
MARPIRCDQCGKESELEGAYKTAPAGWLTVNESGTPRRYWPDYNNRDLCSPSCAIEFLQRVQAEIEVPPIIIAGHEMEESVHGAAPV